MKLVVRLFTVLFLLAGGIVLIRLSIDNRELGNRIDQLEAELGRMSIDDSDRVHLVEIETPDVPPKKGLARWASRGRVRLQPGTRPGRRLQSRQSGHRQAVVLTRPGSCGSLPPGP